MLNLVDSQGFQPVNKEMHIFLLLVVCFPYDFVHMLELMSFALN